MHTKMPDIWMRMTKVTDIIIYRTGMNLIMKLYVKESAYVGAVFISTPA